ncbi:AVB_G0043230.mRNA.1.CDS.1 [Saccharomyces cerevisiae]|nr:AVB_G0043230.mRNA.1.CDS.1 [Saccharomyces cerevisiae]CAI7253443.1 AVB_G0043230.mRNA.1.CDS.1 [Saccharomyces cerevisiae]
MVVINKQLMVSGILPAWLKRLLYYDYQELPAEAINRLNGGQQAFQWQSDIVQRVEKLEDMVAQSDVVTINCPLHKDSRGLFNKSLFPT